MSEATEVVQVRCSHLTEITFRHPDGSTGPHACPCNEASKLLRVYGTLRTEPTTCWRDGWWAALDWLSEYKGAEGIALAEEMSTRCARPERGGGR